MKLKFFTHIMNPSHTEIFRNLLQYWALVAKQSKHWAFECMVTGLIPTYGHLFFFFIFYCHEFVTTVW